MLFKLLFLSSLIAARLKGRAKWWFCATLWVVLWTAYNFLMAGMSDERAGTVVVALLIAIAIRAAVASLFFWLLERFEDTGSFWLVLILGAPVMFFVG
jgi:cation transport ATPase